MPTPGQLQEAAQFPATAFRDPDLAACEPESDALGLPRVRTGAFAAVFRLRGPSMGSFPGAGAPADWAVKAFFDADPSRAARYAALARRLAAHPVPEIVPFAYQDAGLTVEGRAVAVVKMPWADGLPLDRFVARHRTDAARMAALADEWAALASRMEAAGIAHGDLQHGNVLVAETVEAEHAGTAAPVFRLVDVDAAAVPGAPPSNEAGHRNYAHPDRGTATDAHPDRFPALVVYAALKALERHPALWPTFETGENLLFRADDFLDPDASPLLAAMWDDEALAPLAAAVRAAALGPLRRVPRLADVIADIAAGRAPADVAERRIGPGGHVRTRAEALALPVLAAALVACAGLGIALGGTVGAGAAVGVLAAAVLAATVGARRLPVERHRRRLAAERVRLARDLADLDARLARSDADRAAVLADVDAHRARRLEEMRGEVLRERLRQHFVDEATAFAGGDGQGISPRVVVRLKNVGIRTAWEATPARVATAPELGESSRARVLAWRHALDARYAAEVPAVLPEGEIRRLDRMREHRADDLARERARLADRRAALATEDAALAARLDALPRTGAVVYLAYLLRMGPSPPTARTAAAARPSPHTGARANAAVLAASSSAASFSGARSGDAPWWHDEGGAPSELSPQDDSGAQSPGTAPAHLDS